MPATYANPRERAFEIMLSKSKVRLHDPKTGAFLHLSGTGTTANQHWSWLGHMHQADTLKHRAKAHGEDWPFRQVPRDDPDVMACDGMEKPEVGILEGRN
jgi:hypothetical protein